MVYVSSGWTIWAAASILLLCGATDSLLLRNSGFRPHKIEFVSPLLDYGYPPAVNDLQARLEEQTGDTNKDLYQEPEKPILLYLPGFDGTYLCPFIQFPELGTEFEVWCMTIGMEDRSLYEEMKAVVLDFLKTNLAAVDGDPNGSGNDTAEGNGADGFGGFGGIFGGNSKKSKSKKAGRPIYLAGESFGGILASDVALTILSEEKENKGVPLNLQGLVLINPATCYERSQLASVGPPVAKTPIPFYFLGLFSKLLPLFTDEFSLEQLFLILSSKALPSVIDTERREAYMGRVALSLPTKLEFMPPSTLSWRLSEWLQTGSAAVRESSFAAFPNFRSLIVVGEKDKTLPSIAEAERLASKVMNPDKTQIHVVDGAGHGSTCGSRLDLAAVMRYCFSELQTPAKIVPSDKMKPTYNFWEINEILKRQRMKPKAEAGRGPYFGMVQRYDEANIGLNPILYWSRRNFSAVKKESQPRTIVVPETLSSPYYKKSVYTI